MASDIALNRDSDLNFDGSDLQVVTDGGQVAQSLMIGVGTQLGDYALDLEQGIDWRGRLREKRTQHGLESDVRAYILSQPGVARLTDLRVNIPASAAQPVAYTFSVVTTEGIAASYPA